MRVQLLEPSPAPASGVGSIRDSNFNFGPPQRQSFLAEAARSENQIMLAVFGAIDSDRRDYLTPFGVRLSDRTYLGA